MTDRLHSFTLADMVREQARTLPSATAIVDGDARITFAEMDLVSDRWARWLAGHGVAAGGRVVWFGPGDVRALHALFAAAKLGAALVPLNLRNTAEELSWCLRAAEPALVLTTADTHQRVVEALAESGRTGAAPVIDVSAPGAAPDAADHAAGHGEEARGGDDDESPVLGIFTAAFAGRPRLALLTHRGIVTQSLTLAAYRQVEPGVTRYLASGPMFHVGVFLKLLANYLFGGLTVLAARPRAAELCRLIERERVTSALLFTPTIDEMVVVNADRRFDLSSLKEVPAHPSGPEGEVWYAMTGCPRPDGPGMTGYGQTETYAMVTYEARGPSGAGAFGRPSPVAALRIAGPDGGERPAGEPGEILVRGPQVMAGYAAESPPPDGWHHTGDLGVRHPDGTVDFIGPIQDVIKTGMENVYPLEVELALRRHPAVRDACVIGVPDARWGESVRAVVELIDGTASESAELIEHTRRHIAGYKKPRSIVMVDELPRVGGRVDRDKVREEWG